MFMTNEQSIEMIIRLHSRISWPSCESCLDADLTPLNWPFGQVHLVFAPPTDHCQFLPIKIDQGLKIRVHQCQAGILHYRCLHRRPFFPDNLVLQQEIERTKKSNIFWSKYLEDVTLFEFYGRFLCIRKSYFKKSSDEQPSHAKKLSFAAKKWGTRQKITLQIGEQMPNWLWRVVIRAPIQILCVGKRGDDDLLGNWPW